MEKIGIPEMPDKENVTKSAASAEVAKGRKLKRAAVLASAIVTGFAAQPGKEDNRPKEAVPATERLENQKMDSPAEAEAFAGMPAREAAQSTSGNEVRIERLRKSIEQQIKDKEYAQEPPSKKKEGTPAFSPVATTEGAGNGEYRKPSLVERAKKKIRRASVLASAIVTGFASAPTEGDFKNAESKPVIESVQSGSKPRSELFAAQMKEAPAAVPHREAVETVQPQEKAVDQAGMGQGPLPKEPATERRFSPGRTSEYVEAEAEKKPMQLPGGVPISDREGWFSKLVGHVVDLGLKASKDIGPTIGGKK